MKFQPEFAILSQREKFEKGVVLFNNGHFFECHDVLEEIWQEWTGKDRTFFQGIIHVAVGFYHLDNENYRGSRSQLTKGLSKLQRYEPAYFGIELNDFLARVSLCLHWVNEREEGAKTGSFDVTLIPILRFVDQ